MTTMHGIRILLVDDSRTMRSLIKRQLAVIQVELVHEADNGKRGFEILQDQAALELPIDLVISDWNMPEMTGLELLRKVRGTPELKHVPFMMVTAEDEPERVGLVTELGVSGYIKKPFVPEELQQKILEALGRGQSTRYHLARVEQERLEEEGMRELSDRILAEKGAFSPVILDFRKVSEISLPALREMFILAGAVKQDGRQIAIVASEKIRKFLDENGLDQTFSYYASFEEAQRERDPEVSKERGGELLNAIQAAVLDTLKVAARTNAQAGKVMPLLQGRDQTAEIMAMIGISSKFLNGALAFGFPTKTYLGLMSRMFREEYTEITPEIRDGAAEFLNIVLGQAKTSLNERGFEIQQALPTMITGTGLNVSQHSSQPGVLVLYTTDVGNFFIKLTSDRALV